MEGLSKIQPKEVFTSQGISGVDFEIAFTALLATISLGTGTARAIRYVSYSLLLLTLIRRMAVANEITKNDHILDGTRTFVLSLSYVLIIYQLNNISILFQSTSSLLSTSIVLIAVSVLLFLGWVLIQELIFGDLSVYLAIVSNNEAYNQRNTAFSWAVPFLFDSAKMFATVSKADSLPEPIADLQEDTPPSRRRKTSVTVFLLAFLGVIYGSLWFFFPNIVVELIALLTAAILIQYPVDFLYSRHGAVGFYHSRSGWAMARSIFLGITLSFFII